MRANDSIVTRDMQRIMKIDAEILEMQYLYVRELERERELNKHTLLLSRGFKNRIDVMRRSRNHLMKLMKDKPSQTKTYNLELTKRKEELEDAYTDMRGLEKDLKNKSIELLVHYSDEKAAEFRDVSSEIKKQRTRISNKERALENWAKKSELVPERQTRNRLPKEYDVNKDIDAIYGQLPIDATIEQAAKNYQNPLEHTEGWNRKVVNNASIDLLTRPEEKKFIPQKTEEELAQENPWLNHNLDSPLAGEDEVHPRVVIDMEE